MRLTIATTLLCAGMSAGAQAQGSSWQWQTAMTFPTGAPMSGNQMKGHMGEVVYAADGAPIGTLDPCTTDDDGVVHASMFFMGDMKYLVIPGKDLAAKGGKLYVHDVAMASVKKVVQPEHLVVGL